MHNLSEPYKRKAKCTPPPWMHWRCEPFSPLQPSKTPETPNLSKICPSDCFGGFRSGGLKFGKICQKLSENYRFSNFWQIFPNFSPPDWNPPKQSLGQILDKFGVSGVFEGCKGEKGSQHWRCSPWLLWGWCADCGFRFMALQTWMQRLREP